MHIRKYVVLLLAVVLCLFAGSAFAQENWAYRVDEDGFAHITVFDGSAAETNVPEKLDGKWVTGIDANAFVQAAGLQRLTVPGTVVHIDEQAFAGQNVTLRAVNGSTALAFAQKHGMPSVNLSTLDFVPGVVDFTGIERSHYSYVANGVRMIKAQADRLKVGSLFFMPGDSKNELGEGYQVRAMQEDGEYVIVKMSEAAPDLILESLHFRVDSFRVDADGIESLNAAVHDIQSRATYDANFGNQISFSYDFAPGCSVEANFGINVSNFEFDASFVPFTVERFSCDVSTSFDTEIGFGLKVSKDEEALMRIPLINPVSPVVLTATIFGSFEASGGLKLTVNIEAEDSLLYTSANGWDNQRKKLDGQIEAHASAEVETTLTGAFTVKVPVVDDVAFCGLVYTGTASVESAYEKEWPDTATCFDGELALTAHGKMWIGIQKKITENLEIDSRIKWEGEPIKMWEGEAHFEDGEALEKCTKKGVYVYYDTGYELEMEPIALYTSASGTISIPLPDLTRPGYTFLGWYDGEGESANRIMSYNARHSDGSKTLYARWQAVEPVVIDTSVALDTFTAYGRPGVATMVLDQSISVMAYHMSEIVNDYVPAEWDKTDYSKYRLISRDTDGHPTITSRVWASGFHEIEDGCANSPMLQTVVIPDTVERWYHSSIYGGFFKNCPSLTSVRLPESAASANAKRHLDNEDFYGCISLPSIRLPSNYTFIGSKAFYGCSSLQTIENLENTQITGIGSGAFMGCTSLKDVKLPQTVTTIGEGAFAGCTSLNSINIPAAFEADCSPHKSITSTVFGNARLETVTLEEGVQNIAGLFWGVGRLPSVYVPGSVTNMEYAFVNAGGLQTATLAEGVETVGRAAFMDCADLTDVTIEAENAAIEAFAFANCTALQNVDMAGVSRIENYAFANTTALETLELTGDEITLRTGAFRGSALKELTISCNKLTIIPDASFSDPYDPYDAPPYYYTPVKCFENLETLNITADEVTIGENSFADSASLQNISISADSVSIGEKAFHNCRSLDDVMVEAEQLELGESAFTGCSALEEITLDAVITSMGTHAFKHTALKELTLELDGGVLPEFGFIPLEKLVLKGSVDSMERSVPYGTALSMLKEVTLPAVTSGGIPSGMFDGCSALEKVTFTGRIEGSVQSSAFGNCTSLQEIALPEGITSLEYYAFSNCIALTRISIPASVTYIANGFDTEYGGAFYGCTALRVVEGADPEGYAAQTAQQYSNVGFTLGGSEGESYTITFLSGNAKIYQQPLELAEGQVITLSAPQMVENGLEFRAWYYDEECTQPVEIPFTMPAHDVTVYAECGAAYEYPIYDKVERSFANRDGVDYYILERYDAEQINFFMPPIISRINAGVIAADAIGPGVERISIPATVFEIEPGAFRRATRLKEIIVDSGNEHYYVQDGALYATDGTLLAWPCAKQAEALVIPGDVTKIADHAFDWENGYCHLEKLYLPDNLLEVDEHAFDGIRAVTDVFGEPEGLVADIAAAHGLDYNRYLVVYLSEGEVYGFMEATAGGYLPAITQPTRDGFELYDWGDVNGVAVNADTFIMPEEDVILRALWNETNVNWFVLPKGLKTIGTNAFSGLTVPAVLCPGSVETIESGAFAGNTALEIIKLPATVTSIASDAFDGCTSLTIHGYTDSEAQTHAEKHSIPFVTLD